MTQVQVQKLSDLQHDKGWVPIENPNPKIDPDSDPIIGGPAYVQNPNDGKMYVVNPDGSVVQHDPLAGQLGLL